jgi:CheY-like chemotaxis protein
MPRPVNALIVDDEPHVVVLFRALLKELGVATVWDASGAADALEQASAHNPQVVLLDLNLPQTDGLQVLEQLRTRHPAMPVVIVTAQSTLRTLDRARQLGAQAYVLKYRAKSEVLKQLSDAFDAIAKKQGDNHAAEGDGGKTSPAESP